MTFNFCNTDVIYGGIIHVNIVGLLSLTIIMAAFFWCVEGAALKLFDNIKRII